MAAKRSDPRPFSDARLDHAAAGRNTIYVLRCLSFCNEWLSFIPSVSRSYYFIRVSKPFCVVFSFNVAFFPQFSLSFFLSIILFSFFLFLSLVFFPTVSFIMSFFSSSVLHVFTSLHVFFLSPLSSSILSFSPYLLLSTSFPCSSFHSLITFSRFSIFVLLPFLFNFLLSILSQRPSPLFPSFHRSFVLVFLTFSFECLSVLLSSFFESSQFRPDSVLSSEQFFTSTAASQSLSLHSTSRLPVLHRTQYHHTTARLSVSRWERRTPFKAWPFWAHDLKSGAALLNAVRQK